jgi:penicillin-binding protein 2
MQRLSELLNMPMDDPPPAAGQASEGVPLRGRRGPSIETILKERTVNPYAPVRIATNVDRQAAFIIAEEQLKLPGVSVEAEPLRQYTEGPLMGHILGYVGRIPRERLQHYLGEDKSPYQPDDLVGLSGIEYSQERLLRGTRGQKHIEVDAFEREVRVIAADAPTQGHALRLTIDLELQRVTENALREGMRQSGAQVGVAVVMDPRTGAVLAMSSLPGYDNNLFAGGISVEDYAKLGADKRRPLVNHAISGLYPPGSTFKLVPASGALQERVIDRNTHFGCPGIMYVPNKYFPNDMSKAQPFYCWLRSGHGALDVVGGLMQSCDCFFYQATGGFGETQGLGVERLGTYARMFGYGAISRVDLPGEAPGLIPSDRWKRENYNENWLTGDTYNAAIGQGYVLATPLQVANMACVVANGGTLYRPQLIAEVLDAEGRVVHKLVPEVLRTTNIAPENLALVRQGMREAVEGWGTAITARVPGVVVAGKTGSAEFPALDEEGNLIRTKEGHMPTHAWFTGYAPFDAPQLAIAIFLEAGGEGSRRAAPVSAEIMRYYFGVREPTPVPTPTKAAATG